jgi:glycosyltransferase involved in cell wall biosynthesis
MVYAPRFGSRPATILLKYAVQWWRTAGILRREQPDVVFVMTPPVIAALPAFAYAWLRGKSVVFDAHTDAFLHRRWRSLQWLQRWLSRRAATTLVHSEHIASLVQAAGAPVTLVPDVPVLFENVERFPRPDGFTVAVVCSFNHDEPIDQIFSAARELPAVSFFVTGNPKHLPPDVAARRPANVTLTGFLSIPAYAGLLTDADVVLVLTNLDHTMLRGAYEAVYQGTPVIVSDWPILRTAFSDGAVHVDNTSAKIVEAIERVRANPEAYRAGAGRLRAKKLERWRSTREDIVRAIERSATDVPAANPARPA